MKRLLLCLLVTLSSCYATPNPVYISPIPCPVPKAPAIEYEPVVCADGELLCSTVQQVVALAVALNKEANYRDAIKRCPYIVEEK